MSKRVESKSDVQREIEEKLFERLKGIFTDKKMIKPDSIPLNVDNNVYICPDFYSEEHKIIGEIHAHIGKLKGAQPDKIASDVLKMLLWEKVKGCIYHKIIVVCDEDEYNQLKGKSALAEALRQFDVDIMLIDLDEDDRQKLKDCMTRQNLMNK